MRTLIRWHRRLALWVMVPLLAWAGTGLLHPIMARWQPSAVAMQPPVALIAPPAGTAWSDLPPPRHVLPSGDFREARALTWEGQPWWQLQAPDGGLRFIQARTGREADLTGPLVTFLARHYTGAREPILSVSRVDRFDDEYPFINRYLPVWRVAFARDDGLVAFIEPRTLQMTGLTDTWKTRFAGLFRQLHTWSWWSHEPSRDAAMALMLSAVFILAVTGVVRAWRTTAGSTPNRRCHRLLGWLVLAAVCAWSLSGLAHVLMHTKSRPAFATHPLKHRLDVDQLRTSPPADIPAGARLQLLATREGPVWRWWLSEKHTGHAGHHAGHQGSMLREGSRLARTGEPFMPVGHVRELVAEVTGGARWLTCEPITAFDHEYGFINKRLPVYRLRLDTPDHLSVYVDPADAAIAAVIRDPQRLEGFSFAYLHKATWLDGLGKLTRDIVLAATASAVMVMVLIGIRLLKRRSQSA